MADKHIIGAGLAGLIAACAIKDAPIFEAGKRAEQHKALLRFRDKSVSDLIGIPFKEVRVQKEISYRGQSFNACFIAMANMYARKVSGLFCNRSIGNLDTVTRYIAPPDLYDQLVDRHAARIVWEHELKGLGTTEWQTSDTQIISTIPLPVVMRVCGMDPLPFEFAKSSIHVDRYRLPKGTDLYQTIYFPDAELRAFRASITGDLMIVESMNGNPHDNFEFPSDRYGEACEVARAFGLEFDSHFETLDSVDQKYGKIVEIPRRQREAILYELTRDFNVFSVGRFATWRNILLDDVVHDIGVVERLMNASTYGRGLVLANR